MKIKSDEELFVVFKNENNIKAYQELVNRYKDKLYNYVVRLTGDHDEAMDIVQETLIRSYKYKKSFSEDQKFSSWIFRIALNRVKNHKKEFSRYIHEDNLTYLSDSNSEKWYETRNDDESEGNIYVTSDFKSEYAKSALGFIHEKYREVVYLRCIKGIGYEKIAELCRLPLGTVKSRISRGQKQLKIHVRLNPQVKRAYAKSKVAVNFS